MQFLIQNDRSNPIATSNRYLRLSLAGRYLLISLALVSTQLHAEPVESLSLEAFVETEAPYWEVSVKCESIEEAKLMRKPIDASLWCAVGDSSLCEEDKYALSRKMCDDSEGSEVVQDAQPETTAEAAPSPVEANVASPAIVAEPAAESQASKQTVVSRTQLMREKMQVEEQRILIEQRRLELQARELELKKQQIGN